MNFMSLHVNSRQRPCRTKVFACTASDTPCFIYSRHERSVFIIFIKWHHFYSPYRAVSLTISTIHAICDWNAVFLYPNSPEHSDWIYAHELGRIYLEETFPDNFVFSGPIINQCLQVGNAFPCIVAQTFGERLRTIVNKGWKEGDETDLATYSMIDKKD